MPESAFFVQLRARVQFLENKFVSAQLNSELTDGSLFAPDIEMLAAYRFLVHAEMEDYFERKGRNEIANIKSDISKDPSAMYGPRLYTLANHFKIHLPHEIPHDAQKFKKIIDSILKGASDFLDDNNGIKSSTFITVSLICGKTIDSVDFLLSKSLNDFGESRGNVAHRSTQRVANILAPSAEIKAVVDVMNGIARYFYPQPPSASPQQSLQVVTASSNAPALYAGAASPSAPPSAAPALPPV